jgi:hypothetical protein
MNSMKYQDALIAWTPTPVISGWDECYSPGNRIGEVASMTWSPA